MVSQCPDLTMAIASGPAYAGDLTRCTELHRFLVIMVLPEVGRRCSGEADVEESVCDNLEECVYLHEAWPQVRKWAADKNVLDME